ncbi:hypothetical protein AOLI_G00091850 [Acnodon oligacanthus]
MPIVRDHMEEAQPAFASSIDTSARFLRQYGEHLSPSQRQELAELANQFDNPHIIQHDIYTSPVDDLIDHSDKAWFISTLELTKYYCQVALSPQARPKTAFFTPSSHWHYRVLMFRLHGDPAMFQHLMDISYNPTRPLQSCTSMTSFTPGLNTYNT